MRVLHVIPSVGPKRGGPSVAVRLMAQAAQRAGVHADIAATNDNDRALLDVPLGEAVVENGVRHFYFARDARPYTVSRGLAAWLRAHAADYDLLHVHALFSFSTVAAAFAARRARVPYIIRPLGTLAPYGMTQHPVLKQISWRLLERRIVRNAAAVHFTSEAERLEAGRMLPLRNGVVVPLGVDITRFSTGRLERSGPTFLFMSRLHPKKQLEHLLDAVAGIAAIRLIVAGSGEPRYVESLVLRARDRGIEDRVSFVGFVDGAAKVQLLASSDVFVLPSINENFGIAAVEALASGLPAIVSDGVAIHREIEAAGAGIVVDQHGRQLSAALRTMLDDTLRTAMSARARLLAEDQFSMDAMGAGLVRLYERVQAA